MCGIAGEYRFDGQQSDMSVIDSMLAALEPRGPDDAGRFQVGPIALGHRRLSIIDLSQASHQPMIDNDLGLAIVFNGTIYNYQALRDELKQLGHTFRSTGDTEVIIKAYAQWGEDCLNRFNGMFAFAIWSFRDESIWLARDRFGIKPLYYTLDNNRIRFASNTQALLAAGDVDTRFDPFALHHLFSLHAVVPAPRTILQGIRKLPPAHSMRIDRMGHQTLKRYWTLQPSVANPASVSAEEWIELAGDALSRAVKLRIEAADVPVGVLLSGGLDSSLLVALLVEQGQSNLETFSIGFEDRPGEPGNEFEYSDLVVERYQTNHHKMMLQDSDVISRLPDAIGHMAEPMFAQDAVAFYLLSEAVSKYVKVVQSGQGADEVFAGYFWYQQMHESSHAGVERFRPYYFDRSQEEMAELLMPDYLARDVTSGLVSTLLLDANQTDYLNSVLHMDVTTLIVDDPVKRVDNMTMAMGLEARVPFLDHELVEVMLSMPAALKLADGAKTVLKSVARSHLPDKVIDRKKGYFPVPALKYLQDESLELIKDTLNSSKCLQRGLFQREYVNKLLASPNEHFTRIQGNKLWHLASLELWLQKNSI